MADTIVSQAITEVLGTLLTQPVLVTQAVVEVLYGEQPLPPLDTRVTQVATEVITQPLPLARATQVVTEVISGPVLPPPPQGIYVTQLPVEVITAPVPAERITQAIVEVLTLPPRIEWTTQLVMEVLTGPPMPTFALDLTGSYIGLTWAEFTLEVPPIFTPTRAVPRDWDAAPRSVPKPAPATATPIYSQNWSAGNSLFSSMGTYNSASAGVDPLYPEIKSARAVYVNPAGHLDRNPAITADGYDDGRVAFDGIGPLSGFWNADEGVVTAVYKPNATSLSQSYYNQLLILSDWGLALWHEGQGDDLLTLECQVLDGSGTDYIDFQASYAFTSGTTYAIRIEWRCAQQNVGWTDADTSGWFRVLINGVVVMDVRNLKLSTTDTGAAGYASYTYNRARSLELGNGMLGEHVSVVLEDVVADPPPGPALPANTTCETAEEICGTLPRAITADLTSYFSERHPLWYVLHSTTEATVELDFTGAAFGHTVYVYRGTTCADMVQVIDTASGSVSQPLKLRFGTSATTYVRVESGRYDVPTALTMTVRDGRLAERAVIAVFVQGNTNAVLGPGNGIQSGGPEEMAWTLGGDLLRSPLVSQSNYCQTVERNVNTGTIWASTRDYNGIMRFTPDMGLLDMPVPTVSDGRYTSGLRLDDAGRLYRIQWPTTGSTIPGRVSRLDPSAGYAETVLLTLLPAADYVSAVRGSGMCPSRDGSFLYLAYEKRIAGVWDITTAEWVHKYSAAGTYLGTFCHLPGSGTLTPSIVMDIQIHPVTGDVFVSADKYKFYFPGGPSVELVSGGSLLHYNASGTLLHTWFDTPWVGSTPPYVMYRINGFAFDPDDDDIFWVSRERLQVDYTGNAAPPLGSLAKVRISTGAVISDVAPHGYNYGYQITLGGLGPVLALAPCAPPPTSPEVELNSDVTGSYIGLTWVEFTEEVPPIFIPTKAAPPDWDVAPKQRPKPKTRRKKRGPNG